MKPMFSVFKSNDYNSWVLDISFDFYEEAESYLRTYYEVTSHQYWKIEKVWSWPF